MGKDPIKMSKTLISLIGQGTVSVTAHSIYTTDVGARDTLGATSTIRDSSTNSDVCNVGDIVKYVNLVIQAGGTGATPEDETNGWLEWGVVFQKEAFFFPSNTGLGLQTLQDVLIKQFRGDCIMTGQIPIGNDQPITQEIRLKLPKKACKLSQGCNLNLFFHFRSVSSTNVQTDTTKVVTTSMYKRYV